MGSGVYKRNTATLLEYEERKRKELEAITDEWLYIRCYDRSKGKHTIECVKCGARKLVYSFDNIAGCTDCVKERMRERKEQSRYKECAVCGAVFKPIRSTAKYCCERCSRKAKEARRIDKVRERRRTNKRLREARATNNGKVDYSITLSKLIERDNHICKLCGREVNESDYVYDGDTFIAGNDYPSIDHIKPLSKGGLHQWNNVQLAHRLCNSIKHNKEEWQ